MPTFWPSIPENLQEFIVQQPLFFVASAPLTGNHINVSPKGHPSRTFAVLGPNQVAYVDSTGSGAETISHIYENGRVTVMFCSFVAAPRIVRLFCRGRVVERGDPQFRPWIEKMRAAGMRVEHPEKKLKDEIDCHNSNNNSSSSSSNASENDDGDEEEAGKKKKKAPSDVDLSSSDGAGIMGARAVIVLDVWKVQKSCGYGVPLLMMGADGKLAEGKEEGQQQGEEKEKGSQNLQESNQKDRNNVGGHDGGDGDDKKNLQRRKDERSTDVYNLRGVVFDSTWDDRGTMVSWANKMVGSDAIQAYRKLNNTSSLDGLPGLLMVRRNPTVDVPLRLRAWSRRTFVGQWQAVMVGFLLALLITAGLNAFTDVIAVRI